MSKVTKSALIAQIADHLSVSQAQAEKFLSSFIETVTTNLKKDNEITITGFGTFKKSSRKARIGVNPKTLEKIKIPASTSVSFKVGKTLKDAV